MRVGVLLVDTERVFMDTVFSWIFFLHDQLTDWLIRFSRQIKGFILAVAYISLTGVFFPDFRRDFGNLALTMLLMILFLSPLSKLLQTRLLLIAMSFRRELGILMGCLAIVHGLGYTLDPDWMSVVVWNYWPHVFQISPQILFGFVAFTLTLPLLVTSNRFSQQRLGRFWKPLHRLVYPLLFFALIHAFAFGRLGTVNISSLLGVMIFFGVYAILRIAAARGSRTVPFFGSVQRYVAKHYGAYVMESRQKNT